MESLGARVIYIEQGLSADFLLFRAAISGDPGDPYVYIVTAHIIGNVYRRFNNFEY